MICTPNDQHLTIQLYGSTSSAHVHVLLKSFYERLFDAWQSHPRFDLSNPSYARVKLNPVSSLIVNDRKLPEEYDSIQGRERANRTLPPPGLLMNPVKVDETTTKAKEASAGTKRALQKSMRNVQASAGTKRALQKSMRNVQEPVFPRHEMSWMLLRRT